MGNYLCSSCRKRPEVNIEARRENDAHADWLQSRNLLPREGNESKYITFRVKNRSKKKVQ